MIRRIIANYYSKDFYKFIFVGGIAATANFFSRVIFNLFVHFIAAVLLAYVIGLLTAFTLNRTFVFKSVENNTGRQFLFFIGVNLVALIQTVAVSGFLEMYLLPEMGVVMFSKEIAHFFGICVPMFSSFLGHKYITFSIQKK